MTVTSKTVVFFGNERLATGVSTQASTLRALIDNGYHVAAVVSHNEETRSRNSRELEIAGIAAEHNIPLLLPHKPAEILDQLAACAAQVGVLVAYGKIVPQSVIDIFPKGIINIHPSLLPQHRGPIPLESVILDGATETGVSVMQLVKAMDAGPVYAQQTVALSGTESKQALADKLLQLGSEMIIQALPGVLDGSLQPRPQDDRKASYDNLIQKSDGVINWQNAAPVIERQIRAYAGWPGSRTQIGDKEVIITQAHVQAGAGTPGQIWHEGKQFGYYTSDGIVVIDALKPAGKQAMTGEAFLAGYRQLFE